MNGHLGTALLGLLWIVSPLRAQVVSGSLVGRVVTEQGQPVEGAQIAIQGVVLQGTRSSSTDLHGRFSVQSLPAGSYVVTLRRIGYGPVRIQDVPIRLGSTTSLGEVRMTQQAVDVAEITVSGAQPVIDPVSPATGATLDSSQLLSLPAQRDFRALISFLPQANATPFGDGANIAGATGLENAFYIDGMDVTVGPGTSVDLPFNFVREIHVATGGYDAEYGRALSGVVNVVTQSGGNQFHGQALGFFTSDELRSSPRTGLGQVHPDNYHQYDFGLSLSGPIKRDRIWYFAAYDPTYVNQDATVGGLKERDRQVHHLLAGKLSWSPSERTDATLTLLADPYSHDTVSSTVLPGTISPSVALGRATGGGSSIAAQVRHALDPRTEFRAAISQLDRTSDYGPQSGGTSLAPLTRIDDFTTNASTGGVGQVAQNEDSRSALRLALRLQRGIHSVKLGAEYEDNAFSTDFLVSNVARVADSVYDWLEIHATARVHNRVPALYGQDEWELTPRLRVSMGLRWEAQYISGNAGPNRTVPRELAPRLGAVYAPGEAGTQRLFASAGRFYEQVVPYSVSVWNGSGVQSIREYPQNPLVDSANGVLLGLLDLTAGAPLTTRLLGQYYDQLSLGYERRLGNMFKFGAVGTYRILGWVLEDGIAPGDSVYRMGNPGRGPLATMARARQRYAAMELRLERSTPGPLYVLASYVLSRNAGNYTGLYASDVLVPLPNAGPQFDFPDVTENGHGRLPNDRTHVAKSAVSYRFGFGVALGGFLTVASGLPRSEYGTSAYGFPYWTFLRPRGTAGQTPTIWSLDLHGSYDFPRVRSRRLRPRLTMDVFNVGSPRRPLLYDQRHYLDNARTQSNPNYGSVTHYQAPMNARVGMIVNF